MSYKYDATGRRTERLMEDLVNSTTKVNKWTYLGDEQWSELNYLNQVLAVTLNGESIDDIVSLSITPDSPVCNDKAYIRTRLADLNSSRDTAVTQMNLINARFGAAFAEAMTGGAFAVFCKA